MQIHKLTEQAKSVPQLPDISPSTENLIEKYLRIAKRNYYDKVLAAIKETNPWIKFSSIIDNLNIDIEEDGDLFHADIDT